MRLPALERGDYLWAVTVSIVRLLQLARMADVVEASLGNVGWDAERTKAAPACPSQIVPAPARDAAQLVEFALDRGEPAHARSCDAAQQSPGRRSIMRRPNGTQIINEHLPQRQ